jgi:adenine-specific DNA-methyltransferase
VPWTWWPHEEVGNTDVAKKEIYKVLGRSVNFETPKPLALIERIIKMATNKNDIILDSFAGSGTTAHATLRLNKQDGGNRKFILVEIEDYADEVTAERIKRAITGYADEKALGGEFDYYELGEQLLCDGMINKEVDVSDIRKYIFYTETKQPLVKDSTNENPFYLGYFNNSDYYFYYMKDKVTALNHQFLSTITRKAEQYIIYADKCGLDKSEMARKNIVFKKIPRDINKL